MSVSMESCEGEVALEVEGESSRDSELPLTFIHSMTVVPVAVLEPDRDLWKRKKMQSPKAKPNNWPEIQIQSQKQNV